MIDFARKNMKLEELPEEKQEWLLGLACHAARLEDLLEPLAEMGVEVSLSTLTRFVRKHKQEQLLSAGEDLRETAEALVKRNGGETFRKGTLEAVRQRLYEQALDVNDPEGARRLYGDLLREEERMKELELAERKMAVVEEQMRLQRLRFLKEARPGRKLKSVEVVESQRLTESSGGDGEALNAVGIREKRLVEFLGELEQAINQGGPPEEKVMVTRMLFADWWKEEAVSAKTKALPGVGK